MQSLPDFKKEIINLVNTSDDLIKIKEVMRGFFLNIGIPNYQLRRDFLVRARYNKTGEIFNSVEQLSYNPNAKNITLQSANYPNQQIFYASVPTDSDYSTCSSAALVEIALEYVENNELTREYFTLSKWSVSRPLNVIILPFSKKSIERNNDFLKAYTEQNKILDDYFNNKDVPTKKAYIEALEFISDAFSERTNRYNLYKITSTYFNLMLEFLEANNCYIDGIVYPSANTDAAGMNIALKKELVDNGILTMDYVVMSTMQRDPNNKKSITFGRGSEDVFRIQNNKFEIRHIY